MPPRDPNQGPPIAWILLGLIVAAALAAVFLLGPLCPQPESWRDHKRGDADASSPPVEDRQ